MADPSRDQYKKNLRGFRRLTGIFNGFLTALVVECYAMEMPSLVLLLSCLLLEIEAVVENSIRPYWNWVLSQPPTSASEVDLEQGAYASEAAESSSDHATNADRRCDIAIAGATFLKVGISVALVLLVLFEANLKAREYQMLLFVGAFVVFLEGFPQTLLVREEFESFMEHPPSKIGEISEYIAKVPNWRAVNFLAPSITNAMICSTGIIVLGGSLGNMLSEKTFWNFVAIVVVDIIGEAIQRYGCGSRSLSDLKLDRIHILAPLWRMVLGGLSCYFLFKHIHENSFLAPNMDATVCDPACKGKSKEILMAMVVLGGFQAAGLVTTLFSSSLSFYVPCIVFYTILLFACLLLLPNWITGKFFQILHKLADYCKEFYF